MQQIIVWLTDYVNASYGVTVIALIFLYVRLR